MTLSIPCSALALAKLFGAGLLMINFGLTIGRIPIVKLFDMGAKQAMAQRNLKKIFIMYTNFKDIIMVLIYLFINRVGSLSWSFFLLG